MPRHRPALRCLLLLLLVGCDRGPKQRDEAAKPSAAAAVSDGAPPALSLEAPPLAGADRLLKAEQAKVLDCYAATPRTPAATGSVAFSIALDDTGVVSNVGVTRTGSLPAPVAACVRALLVDVTFDPPAGGATTLNGRFTFAPAGPSK